MSNVPNQTYSTLFLLWNSWKNRRENTNSVQKSLNQEVQETIPTPGSLVTGATTISSPDLSDSILPKPVIFSCGNHKLSGLADRLHEDDGGC